MTNPMLQGLPPRNGSVGALKWRFHRVVEEIRGRAGGTGWRSSVGEERRRGPERQGRLCKGDPLMWRKTDEVLERGFGKVNITCSQRLGGY